MKTTTMRKPPPPPKPKSQTAAARLANGQSRKAEEKALAVHIGHVIRTRRKELGLSQEKLGDMLGITFQQVQKYEKGSNRTSSPTLLRMAAAMAVPIDYFFPKPGQSMEPQVPALRTTTLDRLDALAEQVRRLATALEEAIATLKQAAPAVIPFVIVWLT